MDKGLELKNLSVAFGKHHVLDGLDVRVQPGRIYGLLGLNGSGKSTMMLAILGLVSCQGEITFDGQPVDLKDVGAIINGPSFYPHLSARQNLQIHCYLTGTDTREIERVLAMVGLEVGAARAGTFSTGMKVRLGLAMALLTDPSLLLLDEPQNGLDPAGINQLRVLIQRLAKEGKTIVISSHQLGEVARMADDVGVLSKGKMQYQGTIEDLASEGETLEDAFLRLTLSEGAQ